MSSENKGDYILELLGSLTPEPLGQNVRHLYEEADQKRQTDSYDEAIKLCRKAMLVLEKPSQLAIGNLEANMYAKGRCYLLIASIYLNQEQDTQTLEEAKEYYILSQREFHSMQWSQFESLAYLGLAITQRKLRKFSEASDACENAQQYVDDYSVPTKVITTNLRKAIEQERLEIQKILSLEEKTASSSNASEKKLLPIFRISAGDGLIAAKRRTNFNLISRKDYEEHASTILEEVFIDSIKYPGTATADYILEIDQKVKVRDHLKLDDWLLIGTEDDPTKLRNGVTVAVLEKENDELYASLKTFSRAQDHYFLQAKSPSTASIVIAHYRSDFSRINDYYAASNEKIVGKRVYDVRVSGAVIGSIKDADKTFIWNIPVISDIAAGLGTIPKEKIEKYLRLDMDDHKDADFGVRVIGDSMKNQVLPGDIALIHRQGMVKKGEIAAVMIVVPGIEPLGTLKRFHIIYEKRKDLYHWLLESSNPLREHLVVMPSGTDIKKVQNLYTKKVNEGKINPPKYYENARVVVAGKYVGLVPNGE